MGSGAARGMAHIGVLQALEGAGIRPDIIAGTSIGALVGGVYAAGKLDELEEVSLGLDWKKAAGYFLEVSFPRSGLIEGTKVTDFLSEIVGSAKIGALPVRYASVAADVMTGNEVVISDGDLVSAIRASISVPGIFTPARRNGSFLVDGGLVNPVPVSVCRAMGADVVIAVDLNNGRVKEAPQAGLPEKTSPEGGPGRSGVAAVEIFAWLEKKTSGFDVRFLEPVKEWMSRDPAPGIFDVLGNSLRIMEEQIAAARLEIDRPDMLIRPAVGNVRFLEFHLAGEMIAEGFRSAKEVLAGGAVPEQGRGGASEI
ncbi:MAG TPA: patatin-like phospholipase family protein [Aminivibrio sp.]|uniref:patatin-like phospholipase family protein n=1 Tax=Aminivibrio sp. TaxID=1872489 RepID=UPI002B21B62A|nr:patatin-like phospholipase family protein [Aminivibrio sp.]MEA4953109.1 patatin-like phospholipase family protein [Aminivibrio sp.]HPK06509.1 patatin-like phospholipase family protein [Aminivibrio sp.]HRX25540.1 patatin-like phospholipase family protein [Aminivibrio sp.]